MITLHLILLIAGLVLIFLAGINVSVPRISAGWLGLFLVILSHYIRV